MNFEGLLPPTGRNWRCSRGGVERNRKEEITMKQGGFNRKRIPVPLGVLVLGVGMTLLVISGCSVFMAAKQPDAKNLSVLDKGNPRSHVIAELGAPVWSGEKDGNKVDVFAFRQGYSKGAKAGRAFFHGVADVFTLGLWEVIGTPIEATATGTDMKVEVFYDENDLVKLANFLEVEKTEAPAGADTQEEEEDYTQ